ncbi:threonine aldolase [Sphingomonas sp. Leaf412]|uniref:DSD1 family PLP-dependent enzyme n=1 Tax=Sphingomonas sp. Leaf412 TaxID=1736370 RepID=UPI0006FC3557|nr:DSD1 family PLP-dependent enzyme [Sphingomonas sp. Leaf412]KQT32528.1 threonine aldolase [Sphingomonas sp. Leaf412]
MTDANATTASQQLHGHLIGLPGSRDRLNTPALILDIDAFDRNVARMAIFARRHGLNLRPHAKSHKSADIARAQLAGGAVGLCCAKLGEAEALAAEGIDGLHLTSPVVTAAGIARLATLSRRLSALSVVADHPDIVDALASAAHGGPALTVFVDIDPGIHRTGVASPEDAVTLARRIVDCPNLTFGGVQFYCGAQQHIARFADRRTAIVDRTRYLSACLALLAAAGMTPPVVTGGGTGSHVIDAELGVLTELQVGSYIFMDREYSDCDLHGDDAPPFETSLMVDARVISANASGLVTIDAGLKAFATEAGAPPVMSGAGPDARYRFMGDEHGAIVGTDLPGIGARVTLGTPHCDPTVNLYDAYHVVRGDVLTAIWPVTARGRST